MKRKYSYSAIKLAYFETALDYCKFHFNHGIIMEVNMVLHKIICQNLNIH